MMYYLGLHIRNIKDHGRLRNAINNIPELENFKFREFSFILHEFPIDSRENIVCECDPGDLPNHPLSEYVIEIYQDPVKDYDNLNTVTLRYLEDTIIGFHPITTLHFSKVCEDDVGRKECLRCHAIRPLSEFPYLQPKDRRPTHHYICNFCISKKRNYILKSNKKESDKISTIKRELFESGFKVCTKCGTQKSISEFHPSKYSRFGIRPECKDCTNKRQKIMYNKKHNKQG